MSPELELRIRLAVDRRIATVLCQMPCFCTPQRPELGRKDWCAKHWVLARLDKDAVVAELSEEASR